jgi:hypothetical protein
VWLIQKKTPECAYSWPCRRSASCPPWDGPSATKAVLGKAMPPVADNAIGD